MVLTKATLKEETKNPEDYLWNEIGVFRKICLENPHDTKFLKSFALALIKMNHLYGGNLRFVEATQMLKEAKSKLKKVLEADQDDHEAVFEFGVAHFYLYKFDFTLDVKRRVSYCKKAVECFEKVGDKEPESYKGSNLLEKSQSYFRFEAPEVEMDEEMEMDDEMYDKYDDIIRRNNIEFRGYKADCEAAETWNTINPNDVHNLRRWGSALIGLSLCGKIGDMTGKELLKGAIGKFNKALLLEPNDINTKLQLARARLFSFYDQDREEAKDLFKECVRLDAELSALSKASPMASNESIFKLRPPKGINSQPENYNPRRFFSVARPMRSGAPRLGIPAAAMQMHGMRIGRIRSYASAAPILRFLLQKLISRK